jgi:hypothetical protein
MSVLQMVYLGRNPQPPQNMNCIYRNKTSEDKGTIILRSGSAKKTAISLQWILKVSSESRTGDVSSMLKEIRFCGAYQQIPGAVCSVHVVSEKGKYPRTT